MNNELEKFKKNRKLFRLIVCGLALPISAAFLFYLFFTNDNFNKLDAIIYGIYLAFIVAVLIGFTIFDVKRTKLVKKYFGVVSNEDKELANKLLKLADVFKLEFEQVDEKQVFYMKKGTEIADNEHGFTSKDAVKGALQILARKHKVNAIMVNNLNLLERHLDEIGNEQFVGYIKNVLALLNRNITEI